MKPLLGTAIVIAVMNPWLVTAIAIAVVIVVFAIMAEVDQWRRRRRRELRLHELYRDAAVESRGDSVERLRGREREHDRGAW